MSDNAQSPNETEQIVIEDLGKRDWGLYVRDGNLVAGKMIPYDGVLVFSTEQRSYVSPRKNSQFNLTPSEVVDCYVKKSETASSKDQLYADAMELLGREVLA